MFQDGPPLKIIGRQLLEKCLRRILILVSLLECLPMNPSLHCSYERPRSEKEDTEGTRCKCHQKLSSHFAMRGQPILTAVGADYVCRQGEIRDRAFTRCAGKIKQPMGPLDVNGTGSCFTWIANLSVEAVNEAVKTVFKHMFMPDDLLASYQGIALLYSPLLTKVKPGTVSGLSASGQ